MDNGFSFGPVMARGAATICPFHILEVDFRCQIIRRRESKQLVVVIFYIAEGNQALMFAAIVP